MRHLRTPGQPGTLTRINIDRMQHAAGVSFSIFAYPARKLPHLEGSWLPMFRETLSRLGASLEIADMRILPPQRVNDKYIMDLVIDKRFSDREVRFINYCRYFFQCLTISDICSACGTRLAHGIYSGEKTQLQSVSKLIEPYQEYPGLAAWTAWRKFLKGLIDKDGRLRQPLGEWTMPAYRLRRRWPFLFSPSRLSLYKRHKEDYRQLDRIRNRIYSFRPGHVVPDLPSDCVPIDIKNTADGYLVPTTTVAIAEQPPKPFLSDLSFREYLDLQEDHERCALLRYDTLGKDIHDVVDALMDLDDIVLVTDGGADRKCGSYGWVLGTSSGSRIAQGSGSVFGYDPSSYRAEISGSRAGLLFICHAHVYCERTFSEGVLRVYCDNSGYVSKINSMLEYSLAPYACCMDAEWDLLISAHQLFSLFSKQPQLLHIKGHQDRHTPYEELDPISQMNVDADALATREMIEYGRTYNCVPFDPTCKVLLHIDGRTVTRDLGESIQEKQFLDQLRSYLCARFQWSSFTFESIDWETYHQVYSKYPRSKIFSINWDGKNCPPGKDYTHENGGTMIDVPHAGAMTRAMIISINVPMRIVAGGATNSSVEFLPNCRVSLIQSYLT